MTKKEFCLMLSWKGLLKKLKFYIFLLYTQEIQEVLQYLYF